MKAPFLESRRDVLAQAMRDIALGLVIERSVGGLGPLHVPFEVVDDGADATLRCHMPRRRPGVEGLRDDSVLSVTFTGPGAYISPAWYAEKTASGRVVPTWDYIAVYAEGAVRTSQDPARLHAHLTALTTRFEPAPPVGWSIDDAPAEYIEQRINALVMLEIRVERLWGVWKLSQNRPATDRGRIAEELRQRGRHADGPVAALVQETLDGE